MMVRNPTESIIRVDADTTEYLFPANTSLDVLNAHVGLVLREHPELVVGDTPATTNKKG